ALSNAGPEVPLEELVGARFARHKIEEVFEAAKQEAGLAHYEVRSWVGWHHHVTLSLVALWVLCCERRAGGGGNPGRPRPRGAGRSSAVCGGARPRAPSGSRRR